MEDSSFTFFAKTTDVAITLPSHTSMLTGLSPHQHGISWNDDRYTKDPHYPSALTLFEIAKLQGLSTALVAGKSKFIALAKPGSLDWHFLPTDVVIDDQKVADEAIKIIDEHNPNLFFVHFPNVDTVGHASGWGSHEQIAAVEKADEALSLVLEQEKKVNEDQALYIIVSADHGGSGKKHGAGDDASSFIPFIVSGPKINKDVDLTLKQDHFTIEDVFFAGVAFLDLKIKDISGIERGKKLLQDFMD